MSERKSIVPSDTLDRLIYEIRGQKVMLDADLAEIYGVTTKALNQAAKRNRNKFPSDFMFQLTAKEFENMRSQIVTASNRSQFATGSKRNVRYLPFAFTEHGAIMAANVLNSPRAVQMSVFVVRAFLKMRAALSDNCELARKLAVNARAVAVSRLRTRQTRFEFGQHSRRCGWLATACRTTGNSASGGSVVCAGRSD